MKLSSYQIIILLVISRIFTLMTYVPLISEGYEPSVQLIGIAVSTLLQIIAALPLVFLAKSPSEAGSSVVFRTVICICYSVYFILLAANSLSDFQQFVSTVLFPNRNAVIAGFVLVAVCVYGASCGFNAIARTATMTFAVFAVMLVIMAVSSFSLADAQNYCGGFGISPGSISAALVDDFARSGEIVIFAFLLPYIKAPRRDYYGFLLTKLLLLEGASMLIITVLGRFTDYTDFPFFTLGSSVGGGFRLDALYLTVWTLFAVVKISLLIAVTSDIIGRLKPLSRYGKYISGGLIFLCALPMLCGNFVEDSRTVVAFEAANVLLLGTIIPLIILVMGVVGNVKKNHSSSDSGGSSSVGM